MLYKYAENEKYRLEIHTDDDASSPREWDNFGTMVCWHDRYSLGDEHSYTDNREFLEELSDLLVGYDDVKSIKEKADKYMEDFKIVPYEDEMNKGFEILQEDESYDDYCYTMDEAKQELKNIREQYIDELYEEMPTDELLKIISEFSVILPLYLYDHSGITMSTSDFADRWDSGQVGWTYATKDDIIKEYGSFDDITREKAINLLKSEVDTYDDYLRGDVYGYRLLEKKKCECCGHMDYEELDSCWGFYGDDLKENGLSDYIPDSEKCLIDNLQYATSSDKAV